MGSFVMAYVSAPSAIPRPLTNRERSIATMVAEGMSTKAIARKLDVSPKTIECHRASIMRKIEAPRLEQSLRSSAIWIVRWCIKAKLIDP